MCPKFKNKDTKTRLMTSFCCLYCSLWTEWTLVFGVSIVDFEKVNFGWVRSAQGLVSPFFGDPKKMWRRSQTSKNLLRNSKLKIQNDYVISERKIRWMRKISMWRHARSLSIKDTQQIHLFALLITLDTQCFLLKIWPLKIFRIIPPPFC